MRHTDDETYLAYNLNFRDQSFGDVWVAHDYVGIAATIRSDKFR